MNSIESLKLDFHSQIRELSDIHNKKIFDDCVYVGSGDSYVAGLIAEFLTDHKCRCYSPSDLSNSKFIEGNTYCFISVTGRTTANIKLARRAKECGIKTAAITLNETSELAKVCDEVVPLKITKVNTPTSGFSTFVANVVTCLQLSGVTIPNKFDYWHKKGIAFSLNLAKTMLMPSDTAYVLANNLLYPLGLYTTLQIAEFFGTTAIAHKLEEFCHSPIFGIKKSNHILIFGQNEKLISSKLERLGLRVSYIELYKPDPLDQVFHSIFIVQNLLLLLAEKYGYSELQYLLRQDILKTSSGIIYSV
jgi:fructoselysine-6-P-deglycase FrlB-like protein